MAETSLWIDTQFTIGKLPYYLRLKNLRRRSLEPHVSVDFSTDSFHVKTADTYEEFAQVLNLRFQVFFQEFSSQKIKRSLFPYDVDRFDFFCDHLIVKDKKTAKVVACYRLLMRKTDFYTQKEFKIEPFLSLPGEKIELGRACVAREYRSSAVIGLLWKGLLTYARRAGAHYFFGCCSLTRQDFGRVEEILEQLKVKGALLDPPVVQVQKNYRVPSSIPGAQMNSDGRALNSMMNMYLLAGAKFSGEFAYDKEMDCLDLFTVVDLKRLPNSFERRFS